MTKQIYIALITIIGFFLTPTLSYACGKSHAETEKFCCSNKASHAEKKDCCKKEHSDNPKNNDDCDGKCGNPSCHCPTISIYFGIIPTISELKYNSLAISKKQLFVYTNTYIPSGFYSIWQPPKIS